MDAYHYPAFLDLRGRRCVVVGGGEVAYRKVLGLLPCGAGVAVVGPSPAHPGIERLSSRGTVAWHARPYRTGDLAGAFLAVAATADPAVNAAVRAEAQRERALCNVVDVPEACDFIAPAIFQRGRLVAAISTGGASPAYAARCRRQLASVWGPGHGQWVGLLRRLRPLVRQRIPDVELRRRFWLELARRDELIALCAHGRRDAAWAALVAELEGQPAPAPVTAG